MKKKSHLNSLCWCAVTARSTFRAGCQCVAHTKRIDVRILTVARSWRSKNSEWKKYPTEYTWDVGMRSGDFFFRLVCVEPKDRFIHIDYPFNSVNWQKCSRMNQNERTNERGRKKTHTKYDKENENIKGIESQEKKRENHRWRRRRRRWVNDTRREIQTKMSSEWKVIGDAGLVAMEPLPHTHTHSPIPFSPIDRNRMQHKRRMNTKKGMKNGEKWNCNPKWWKI